MSIVNAINELTGKEAKTIEKAIENVEIDGGGGVVIVEIERTIDGNKHISTLTKTWREIYSDISNGKPVFLRYMDENNRTLSYVHNITTDIDSEETIYNLYDVGENYDWYSTDSADGYPSFYIEVEEH